MKNKYVHIVLFALVSCCLLFSCKREFEKPRWDTQVLAPLVKSKLSIKDIIKDTSTVQTESDNSITLVNRQKIFNYTIDSLITLSAPPFKRTAKLSSLVLDSQTITRRISLGEIAKQLEAQGNTQLAQLIYTGHTLGKLGIKVPVTNIDNIVAGPIDIDINQFFQTATLLTGNMTVSLFNGLPLTISNIEFGLNNKTPPSIITTQTFTNVLPNTAQQKNIDLAGKIISGNIQASINDMDIAGGTVLIDTSNALLLTISIKNIKVQSATAIFPAQNVMDTTTIVGLVDMDDVLLTEAIIREGSVKADITSTADEILHMTYQIPKAIKNGMPFEFNADVPAKAVHNIYTSDVSGYTMNLNPSANKYNQFANRLIARIDYTGVIKTLSLNDSIDITLTFQNAKPSFAKGYLGRDTIAIGPGNVDIDIFKNISASTLNFKSAKMNIVFENALGIPSQVELKELKAFNTASNKSVTLSGPAVNTPHTINPAIESSSVPATTVVDLSTGTNVLDILNILPDKLTYEGTFKSNPAGNTGTYTDFARSGVDLNAYLDLQIPLSLIASNLVLSDTVAFDAKALTASGFQDGKFNLLVWNGFPLELNVDMYFLDRWGKKVDSIITTSPVQAALVDGNGKVTTPFYSVVPFNFTAGRLSIVTQQATQILFKARFDTKPDNTNVTIYSTYEVDF